MNAILMARASFFFLLLLVVLGDPSTRAEISRTDVYGGEKRQEEKKRRRVIDSGVATFLPRTTPVPLKVLLMMTAIEG